MKGFVSTIDIRRHVSYLSIQQNAFYLKDIIRLKVKYGAWRGVDKAETKKL